MPWPKSRSGASCQGWWVRQCNSPRHPDHREKYVALGDQDLAGFRCDPRAGVVRRRVLVISAGLNKRRLWEIWRALLRARSIENLALVVLDPEHGRTWRSRLAFVAVIGGDSCKRARSGMARGRGQPRSHSAEKRLLISHGRNTMAVREQSRSTGTTGSAAELAGYMPP